MDKEQAKILLAGFRPDGSDAGDPAFAEALRLVTADAELARWFARERALDAAFAEVLNGCALPEDLRQNILAVLAGDPDALPVLTSREDHVLAAALAALPVPPLLRQSLCLASQDAAHTPPLPSRLQPHPLRKFLPLGAAAAAGITLALLLDTPNRNPSAANPPAATENLTASNSGPLPLDLVLAGVIRTVNAPEVPLETTTEDTGELIDHLRKRKLPCPGGLPRGLKHLKGKGCKELVIDGRRGSLICFHHTDSGPLHLLILRSEDVACQLPCSKNPVIEQDGGWSIARWSENRRVFLLITHAKPEELRNLF
jgi:hypothetical protein